MWRKDITEENRQASEEACAHVDTSYLDSTLGYRMKRAIVALYDEIYRELDDATVTLVEFSVLCLAKDNPGLTQTVLAKTLAVERPRIVPIIDKLERLKLAERRPSLKDRRRKLVFLTSTGAVEIKRLQCLFDAHQNKLRTQMGAKSFNELMLLLEWFNRSKKNEPK